MLLLQSKHPFKHVLFIVSVLYQSFGAEETIYTYLYGSSQYFSIKLGK